MTRGTGPGPSEAAPAVEVANASRWYGNVVAVNDISFRAGRAASPGLLGPNGAGKSTILHMVAGFLAPSSGSVTVAGSRPGGHPEMYRRIGLVPEREAVYPFLTGRQFVAANARLQGMNGEQAAAAAARAIGQVELDAAAGSGDRHLLEGDAPARQGRRRRSSTTRRSCSSTSRSTGWTRASGCT